MLAMYCSQHVGNVLFCSGSCFNKIYHYNALFLKTFSLAVSLNVDKLQVISAQTEKLLFHTYLSKVIFRTMYFTDIF